VNKQTIAAVAIAASLGTAVGFGLGSTTSPQPADAASGNADVVTQLKRVDADLTRQLKQANAQLGAVNSSLGTPAQKGTVRWLLTTICDYTASVDCGP
jgi:hypothetical protein